MESNNPDTDDRFRIRTPGETVPPNLQSGDRIAVCKREKKYYVGTLRIDSTDHEKPHYIEFDYLGTLCIDRTDRETPHHITFDRDTSTNGKINLEEEKWCIVKENPLLDADMRNRHQRMAEAKQSERQYFEDEKQKHENRMQLIKENNERESRNMEIISNLSREKEEWKRKYDELSSEASETSSNQERHEQKRRREEESPEDKRKRRKKEAKRLRKKRKAYYDKNKDLFENISYSYTPSFDVDGPMSSKDFENRCMQDPAFTSLSNLILCEVLGM